MQCTTTSDGRELRLSIGQRFDFSVHRAFRDAYQHATAEVYVVDLSQTDFIDSSALGMLLLLREHASNTGNGSVHLKGARPEVRNILQIANFQRLFTVE